MKEQKTLKVTFDKQQFAKVVKRPKTAELYEQLKPMANPANQFLVPAAEVRKVFAKFGVPLTGGYEKFEGGLTLPTCQMLIMGVASKLQ